MERGGRLLCYDELQERQPPGSAWGLWVVAEDDEPDEVGTLHLAADPLRLRQAALLVSSGKVFSLNWGLELPDPPLFGRARIQHTIIPSARSGGHNDQIDAFNPQASTQWDGLSHFPHQTHGFYNGVPKQHITGEEGTRLGIEKWARRGIAGRLVLIDFERWIAAREREQNVPPNERYRPDTPYAITPDQVREVARDQGVTFEVGDFLLIRTGWIRWYMGLDQAQREELAGRDPQHGYAWAGLAQGEDSLRFLWDQHFAAVAADCPSFERWPAPSKTYAELLHGTLLGLWGMPIGELWDCEALAEDCAADGRYACFFTSAPLNLRGGVASPANALALKDPTVYQAEAPLGPQLADEDGEPKTDLDRRGQLVARLASILYLEKLKQGNKRENEGIKSTHSAEPDEAGEGERERRQRLKALLLHITDDEGEALHGPKGVAFSTDAKRLLQTFFLEAAGILTEQAEGLALEAWQSRHPDQRTRPEQQKQQRPRPAAAESPADVGHSAAPDHPVDTASDDNEDQTPGLSSASSSSSSVAVMLSSTSPLSTSPDESASPPICSSLSSCSSFASCDALPPPSSLSLSSSFVPVSPTPTTGSAQGLPSTRSQPHAMHSSAPIDTRRTRAAPTALGLDQPSVSWHHVVKAVELLLQLPLGGGGEASDEGPGRALTHVDGDISAAADATLSAAHRRREKARSLSALGRNNMEDPLLRHYSFFRLIDQNVPVFLRLLEGEEQRWEFVSKQHGVLIHRRTIAPAPRGRNIHCFRGVGVIRAPPSVVKEYLFEQKDWALWDCYAKDCREVERLDSCTKIMQFRYETERCFVQHRRDFCALLHLVRRPRGAILLFGQSVEHPMCPQLEGWTRGIALHSGALIEPKKDGEGNLVSKVTIITQIDLVGLPAAIVNMVQVQRPLLIAQIQHRLDAATNQL